MFSLKGRLRAKNVSEKMEALYYLLHLSIIGYCLFFVYSNVYLNVNRILFMCDSSLVIAALMTLFFSLTTMGCHRDYMDIKKYHKNTLDYYIADLNPSRGSIISNIVTDKTKFHENVLSGFLLLSIFFSTVMLVVSLFSVSYFFFIVIYHFILIFTSFILGMNINLSAVNSVKLNEFDDIEDLSSIQKINFRRGIIKILKTKTTISRSDVLALCLKCKKENIEKDEKEESEITYKSYKQKSEELGIR